MTSPTEHATPIGAATTEGETPETGWQPDTPVTDTMLRRIVCSTAESWAAIGAAAGGRVHRDARFIAVDLGGPAGLWNSTTLLRPLHGTELDQALTDIERFYDGRGRGEALLWSPWPTPGLRQRGWHLQGHPPAMLRQADLPIPDATADGLQIVEVTQPSQLRAWSQTAVAAFPFDELQDAPTSLLPPAILGDRRLRFLLGIADGEAVCVGASFVSQACHLLLLAATRDEHRGRGYYSAMAATRLRSHPALPAAAIVSDASRPVLEQDFDFLPLTRFTLWSRPRP